MPSPVYVSLAANVPPLLAPAAQIDPADYATSAIPGMEAIVAGDSGLTGTPKINRDKARVSLLGRVGAGAWGVQQGTGELSGSASPVSISELSGAIDAPIHVDAGTLTLTDNVYNWLYVTQGGTVSKVTQAGATPPPALPNPSVFLGRCLMAAGVLTEIDYSGRQELRGGLLYRRTSDAGVPGDTPPAWASFLHQTAGGLWLWDGGAYRAIGVMTPLTATATWDPGSIADGDDLSTTITVTGAAVGDVAVASLSTLGANDVMISAHVQTANTVRITLLNRTGGAFDAASGTLRAVVLKMV